MVVSTDPLSGSDVASGVGVIVDPPDEKVVGVGVLVGVAPARQRGGSGSRGAITVVAPREPER